MFLLYTCCGRLRTLTVTSSLHFIFLLHECFLHVHLMFLYVLHWVFLWAMHQHKTHFHVRLQKLTIKLFEFRTTIIFWVFFFCLFSTKYVLIKPVLEERSQVLVSRFRILGSLDLHLWRLCQGRVWSLAAVPNRDMPSYCYGNRQARFRHAVCSDALCEMMVQVWPPAGSHRDAIYNNQMCSHKVWHHTETWIHTLYISSIFSLIKLRQPPPCAAHTRFVLILQLIVHCWAQFSFK